MSDSTIERNRANLVLYAAVIFGMPAIAGGSWLLSGGSIPLQSLVVMAGAYVMALSWSAMNVLNARAAPATSAAIPQPAAIMSKENMRAIQSWPALDLMQSVAAQRIPRSIEITAAVGVCPQGFREGDRITVERDGTLSQPLCRTAVDALNLAFETGDEYGNGTDCQLSCLCPLAMRHLTFSIGREQVSSLN